MKKVILISISAALLLTACNSPAQQKAKDVAQKIDAVSKAYGPGEIATSKEGYLMKAVINGTPWVATSMLEINASNTKFVHGSNGNAQIGFYIDKDHIKIGKVRKLGEGHSADLDLGGDNLMNAKSGEFVITKADDKMIEGTFHFSASSQFSSKKGEVTNGFFRVLLK